ncbi:helix-turn-helix domain-containing protein [Rhodopirellula sp. MGV]|uniref:helix-turn-helix domain-containing protein n=1 Tax=Rhodopirellula sp. MGV TaxID=2023130 RepID=UPI0011AF4B0E|nr:DnaA/Hda family protein [Rhodopirellula sp. MGV]
MNSPVKLPIDTFPVERPLLKQRPRETKLSFDGRNASLPVFVAGDENRLVAFVCQSDTSMWSTGPLLLIGPEGSGKTTIALHLAARCSAEASLADDPSAVRYLSALDFAREYADAVAADDIPHLRRSIDKAAVLVIEDLHLIAGKTAAQDELTSRIDQRIQRGAPTILTSRRLPTETRAIRPQLASRAVIGLTIPLAYPQAESRLALLRELSLVRGVEISDEHLALLEAGLRTEVSVRSLDGAIKQIDLHCRMTQCGVDIAAVQSAINAAGELNDIDLGKITRTVAKIWGHRTRDLRSGSRKQSVVRARSLAMLLARRMTPCSLDKIGDYFGGRDHSTVLHAIRKTESLLESDADLSRIMHEAKEKLAA